MSFILFKFNLGASGGNSLSQVFFSTVFLTCLTLTHIIQFCHLRKPSKNHWLRPSRKSVFILSPTENNKIKYETHSQATRSLQSDISIAIITIRLLINGLEEAGAYLLSQANTVFVGLDIFDFTLAVNS